MRSVFLAPHNLGDDETLFGSFTLLRERPHVIVCLRSVKQMHTDGISYEVRERETCEAMDVLGCSWSQWEHPDLDADWREVRLRIADLAQDYDHCFAPAVAFAQNGHLPEHRGSAHVPGIFHHDWIGHIAKRAFGSDRYTGYHTYERFTGKVCRGEEVVFEPAWVGLKLRALACYRSQIELPATTPHFAETLREFYDVDGARLA